MRLGRFRLPVVSGNPSGTVDGDMWFNTSTDKPMVSIGSTPTVIGGGSITMAEGQLSIGTTTTWTSTSIGTGSGGVAGVGFTAGGSGVALILVTVADMTMSTSTKGFITFELRSGSTSPGSGSVVLSGSEDHSVWIQNTSSHGKTLAKVVTGLTAGQSYNARVLGAIVTSGTLEVRGQRIMVVSG